MSEPLEKRRKLLETTVLPKEPCRYTGSLDAKLSNLVASVKSQGLEGWWPSGAPARRGAQIGADWSAWKHPLGRSNR
jgi:hypothetical protein